VYTDTSARLHRVPAFSGRHRLVRTDVQTPGYMRAPFESPGVVRVRGRDGRIGPRHRPGSGGAAARQRHRHRLAIGAYPAFITLATARVVASVDSRITVEVDGHEIGQGIHSAITLQAADDLGVATDAVTLVVGDTRVAAQHLTAGSWGTASALQAVHAAPPPAGRGRPGTARPRLGRRPRRTAADRRRGQHSRSRAGARILAAGAGRSGGTRGTRVPGFTSFSFIAHFVEVRIEPTTRRIRVRWPAAMRLPGTRSVCL
jgi:xanthine dehydrogenase YagR molybdenum-binding subunit